MSKYILRSGAISLSNKTDNSQIGHNDNNSLNTFRQKNTSMQTKQIINPVDMFLARYPKSTIATYKAVLKGYFELLEASPENYFTDNRNYDADILFYAQSIKGKFAPKTYHTYLSCLRKFLRRNNISLIENTLEDLLFFQKIKQPITRDRIPTQEELKNILSFANLKDKAIYLTLLSSGMRIGEVVQFTIHDIHMGESPVRIELDASYCKNKTSRTVFISKECKRYMEKWLEVRQDWLDSAVKKAVCKQFRKSADDDRVFPFTKAAARIRYNKLLEMAGLGDKDRRTKVRVLHIHTLRKYFRTHMANACSRDVIETILGHSGYLTNSYVRLTQEELAKEYSKGMSKVTVFERMTSTGELKQLQSEIKRRDEQLAEIEKRTEFLKALDKKQLQKLMAVLSGGASDKVWEEWKKRPKKWIKNIPKGKQK